MTNTFASQNRDVQNEKDTQTLKEEWPYHEFQEDTKSKYKRVLGYFEVPSPGERKSCSKTPTSNPGEDSGGALLLLFAHFKEDQLKMLIHVDDTWVATDVDLHHLPTTPCILLCGESPMAASAVMAAVDQVVVHDRIFTFTIYYVLNIDYPVVEVEQQWISFKENPEAAG
ncbi:hypothetical protein CgunFtcFv8_018191 [Champsocephalus gunnari]|uniref:Uncharacterized protein n=1 Tax=Champsocephalus gunnari TaxID=52237 RepID=A0AAN8HS66_CHAGU|nr:hypothetical protein CgunFtcFv8_018191 [Champsocephalus gunnari]